MKTFYGGLMGCLLAGILFYGCKTSHKAVTQSHTEMETHQSVQADSSVQESHGSETVSQADDSGATTTDFEITGPVVISPDGTITATSPDTHIKGHQQSNTTHTQSTTSRDTTSRQNTYHTEADSGSFTSQETRSKAVIRKPPYLLYGSLFLLVLVAGYLIYRYRKVLAKWWPLKLL